MKIGIAPFFTSEGGGEYQYSLTLLAALLDESAQLDEHEFVLFLRAQDIGHAPDIAEHYNWSTRALRPNLSGRLLDQARVRAPALRPLKNWMLSRRRPSSRASLSRELAMSDVRQIRYRKEYGNWFQSNGIDWMLYTAAVPLAFEAGFPFVMPIHDLQHRLQPEFPEVSANGEWERREYIFRNAAGQATAVLVDSEIGKEDVLACYSSAGISADRVIVLPYVPAHHLSTDIDERRSALIRRQYDLPERYLFYPAQFWPHKNHLRLIQAIGLLKQRGIEVNLVLCGSSHGAIRQETLAQALRAAERLGVGDQIRLLGYVPNGHMSYLYAKASGLAFPTFFGPTNIPVLEAWAFDCPVLTSDIRGVREHVGDAAVLANPHSVEEIASGLCRLWEDGELCASLIERGRKRLGAYDPREFSSRLGNIIAEVCRRTRSISARDTKAAVK